jgi:DNA-binding transcriptional ArsR family regulator
MLTYFNDMKTRVARRVRGNDVFAAIGDPTRRKVLQMLSSQALAAGEIAGEFRISRPAISQHLLVLRRAKLVAVQKRGREHIYRINPEPLREVYDWVEHYQKFWDEKLTMLGECLDQTTGGNK